MSYDDMLDDKDLANNDEEEDVVVGEISEIDDDVVDDDLFDNTDMPPDVGDEEEDIGLSTEDRDQNY